ncbi:MAG: hypothetical protein ACREP2_14495 [Rhodanobacteraceae bacterium]
MGRVVRTGSGRVTIMVYRAMDHAWVIRSVGGDELERATGSELAKLHELERNSVPVAA